MADRRLLGFSSIMLVIATMISILIFSPGEEVYLRILASRTPDNIPGGRPGSPSYSFELMVARDLPDLAIETYFLVRVWPTTLKPGSEIGDREAAHLIENVPRISEIRYFLDALAGLLGYESAYSVLDIDGKVGRLVVLDFADAVGAMAGEDRIETQYTTYAFMLDEEDRVSIYAGCRDFFLDRGSVITEISYQAPGISKCYRSSRAAETDVCDPILDAPVGRIRLKDLKQNDRVRVDVSLDTSSMFGHSGILQLVTTETGHGLGPTIISLIGAGGK